MWKQLLDSFDPLQEEDPHFGLVELQQNEEDRSYYLMKDVMIGDEEDSLSLTIESSGKKSTEAQFNLYKSITTNFNLIKKSAFDLIKNQAPQSRETNYQVESIYIGPVTPQKQSWELSLLNTADGNSYCVIDFDGLTATGLSIEE